MDTLAAKKDQLADFDQTRPQKAELLRWNLRILKGVFPPHSIYLL